MTDQIPPIVRKLLHRAHSFQLSFRRKWGPYPAAIRKRIVAESILPLLTEAEDCCVFGITGAKAQKRLKEIAVVDAQRLVIRDPLSSVALAPELWQGVAWGSQRCVVWSVPVNGILRAAYRRMFNPMIARNVSIGFPSGAWRHARALAKNRKDRLVLLLPSNNPLDYICFVARPRLLEMVFVEAEALATQTLR